MVIQTKFVPCTNHKPDRVSAWSVRHTKDRVIVSWDYEAATIEDRHKKAVVAWCEKYRKGEKLTVEKLDGTPEGFVFQIKLEEVK